MTDPTPSEAKAATTSLGDLLAEVTRDLPPYAPGLELAKAELKVSAGTAAKAGGLLGGAGYGAPMAVFFLSVALWWSLATGSAADGRASSSRSSGRRSRSCSTWSDATGGRR